MLRGVIFDFDGVIVDSHAAHKRAWKRFLDSVGRKVSEEELEFVLDGRKRDDILKHFLGELGQEQLVAYGQRKDQFFREEALSVCAVGGLEPFLGELESARIVFAVASSGSRNRICFLMDRLALGNRFHAIVTGDEVAQGKPDPAIFLRAAQELRTEPSELLVVEDAVSGVKAARAAGMGCLGIAEDNRAPILLDAGANRVVQNFVGLSLEELQGLCA